MFDQKVGAERIDPIPGAEEIRAFYDAVAVRPDFQAKMYEAEHRKDLEFRVKRILSCVLPFAPYVLELGCADGMISQWVAKRCDWLVGIDLAEPCIVRCKALSLGNAEFHLGALEDVLLGRDVEVDVALVLDVLEHLPDPCGTLERLKSISHAVLASVPVNEEPNVDAFSLAAYESPNRIGDGSGHIWSFRPDSFRALFSEVWHFENNGVTAILLGT